MDYGQVESNAGRPGDIGEFGRRDIVRRLGSGLRPWDGHYPKQNDVGSVWHSEFCSSHQKYQKREQRDNQNLSRDQGKRI